MLLRLDPGVLIAVGGGERDEAASAARRRGQHSLTARWRWRCRRGSWRGRHPYPGI